MKLYKYFPLNDHPRRKTWLTSLLLRGEFYLSSLDDLNDPFEFSFGTMPVSKTGYRTLIDALHDKTRNDGIICLSQKNDNVLMWTHYAERHSGICIEFETKKDKIFQGVNRVHYPKSIMLSTDKDYRLIKSNDWEYEKEYRVIHPDRAKQTVVINQAAITGICTGLWIKEEDLSWLDSILKKRVNEINKYSCEVDKKLKKINWKSGFTTIKERIKKSAQKEVYRKILRKRLQRKHHS